MRPRPHVSVPGSQLDRLRLDALAAKSRGRYAQAVDCARRYLARRPNDVDVMNFLAGTYFDQQQWPEFLQIGLRSYRCEPRAKHLLLLLRGFRELGRYDEALAFYERERRRPDSVLAQDARTARQIVDAVRTLEKERRQALQRQKDAERQKAKAAATHGPAPRADTPAAPPPARPDPTAPRPDDWPEWPRLEPVSVAIRPQVETTDLAADLDAAKDSAGLVEIPRYEPQGLSLRLSRLEDRFASEFHWLHVRTELTDVRESMADYAGFETYFAVEGEAPRDGITEALVHGRSGAVLALPAGTLAGVCTAPVSAVRLEAATVLARATAAAQAGSEVVASEIADRLEQRQRDLNGRIDEANELLRGEWRTRRAQIPSGAAESERLHHALLDELLRRRRSSVAELRDAHALVVTMQPLTVSYVRLPVVIGTVDLARRARSGRLTVTWNPLSRQFEPIPCGRCGRQSYRIGATDSCEVRCAACLPYA